MLSSYLKSISDKYEITFKNDPTNMWMVVRIRKDFIYKEITIDYINLSDELITTNLIRNAIESMGDLA